MPRVLLLLEYPSLNGAERSILSTLDVVRGAGFSVVALAPPRGELATALAARNVPIVAWSGHDARGRRRSQSELRQELSRQIEKLAPDLIHANSLAMARLVGPVAADRSIPSIGHLRDILRLSATALRDLSHNSCLLAVSRATRNWYLAAGLPENKTHVLYNGVDLDQFSPGRPTGYLHRELEIPPSAPLIGSIGQISLRKGFDLWLKASESVLRQFPSHRILIVGQRHSEKKESRQLERQLRLAAGRPPLAGRTIFLGRRHDVSRLLNELTLLVHPARQEPLGRVLLEAAAAGVPIVASDVGGTSEIFPKNECAAELVSPGDPQELSRAALKLLADHGLRQAIGASARRIMQARFDAKQSGRGLVRHYWSVLKRYPLKR